MNWGEMMSDTVIATAVLDRLRTGDYSRWFESGVLFPVDGSPVFHGSILAGVLGQNESGVDNCILLVEGTICRL